jgi:two-component system, OmpR family, alkaline phosphatase synthesis response regulator PhoP
VPKLPTLIVEDDPQLNLIFTLTLQADFEITSFKDGNLALEYLESNSPGMIILDLNLPGATGEEILNYVRSKKRLCDTQVILATADAAKADHLADRVDLILLKPISPIQLKDLALRFSQKIK